MHDISAICQHDNIDCLPRGYMCDVMFTLIIMDWTSVEMINNSTMSLPRPKIPFEVDYLIQLLV